LSYQFESVAPALVSEGKGILAADETVPTLTKRFDTLSALFEQGKWLWRVSARRTTVGSGATTEVRPTLRESA
jgi:Fructose-bisphosphate aldolase class-I